MAMVAIIPVLISALPSIIEGLLAGIAGIKRISATLKDHAPALTEEQRAQLDRLDARLQEGLADVAAVRVRP